MNTVVESVDGEIGHRQEIIPNIQILSCIGSMLVGGENDLQGD